MQTPRRSRSFVLGLVPLLSAVSGHAFAQAESTPGALTLPFPTIENLSIEWALAGDDNENATVSVRYREQGGSYRDGLPLVRIPAGENEGFSWTNRFAGSLFGLLPGTTYEIELALFDPDGGEVTETVTATTRPVPSLPSGMREIAVDPASIDDALDAAGPGDLLVLADGTYGEIVIPNDGSPEQPLALRPENPGSALVQGDVRIDGRAHVHVEGLTVRGKFKFNDAAWIVVRGCNIETPDDGIVSFGSGVENAYIAENVIQGPTIWQEAALGVDGDNLGEGVALTGAGNVVAYNRVGGFRDCLSLLEDSEANQQISDDFYGNDLYDCADDAIEADFSMGNVRVYRNRIVKSFMGLSSQPSLGGPTYFLRNVLYGVLYQAFKLQRASVGDIGFHNTVVKSGDAFSVNTEDAISRAYFRNNLFLGGPGGTYLDYDAGPGDVIDLPSADASCSFDYDGYGSIGGEFAGRLGDVRFSGLAELNAGTSEAHAVELDLATFAADVGYPADPFDPPPVPSLALADAGAAVDRGVGLANVNDGFSGDAPDLGAYELGQPEPRYGPEAAGTGNAGSGGGNGSGGSAGSNAAGAAAGMNGGEPGGDAGAGDALAGGGAGGSNATGGAGTFAGRGGRGGESGGSAGGGQGGAATAGSSSTSGADGSDDAGCGCRTAKRERGSPLGAALALLLLAGALLRRARPGRATP
jgi:hypothetical protein